MILAPWNLVLTALFVFTALICLGDFVAQRRRSTSGSTLTSHDVIDLNHGVMSVAMIVMIWWTVWDAVTWTQVAIFAILAVALIPAYRGAGTARAIDLSGHIALNAAMIWMLAAMPLLMAGMTMGNGGGGHGDHGGGADMAMTGTPAWAQVVNTIFIVISVALAGWWLWRLATARRHRIHILCHIAMSLGMAGMLALMVQ